MAMILIDGFDKYGAPNTNNANVVNLMLGEWNVGSQVFIAAGLSSVGNAVNLSSSGASMSRSFANTGRIIGGVRINPSSGFAISFGDLGSMQCTICAAGGLISLRNGTTNGTILASSASSFPNGVIHFIEWDITIGASANYQVWVDGTSIFSGTGNTRATANNYVNNINFLFTPVGVSGASVYDDLYLFDNTGSVNNAVLLTSPRVETTFPVSDSSVQFAIGASVIGSPIARTSTNITFVANVLYLRPLTAARAMTLNTIYVMPSGTSPSANWRMVVYADNSGLPGALLGQSNAAVGITSGTVMVGNLITPVSLTSGVQYWLGFMCDTASINFLMQDTLNQGRSATATFTVGAPSSAPAMAANSTATVWGAVTLTAPVNFYEVNQQPPASQYSYVYDSVVGHEDLYNFGALSVIPTAVYAVSVKSFAAKSDTGVRTMSNRLLSGGVDSGGSLTGQTLSQSFQWYGTNFDTDPGTSAAWTGVGLNAAQSGFRIDS